MNEKYPIVKSYHEGSRAGKISMMRKKKDTYEIIVDWNEPRYDSFLLFSGNLRECIAYSLNRFRVQRQEIISLQNLSTYDKIQ